MAAIIVSIVKLPKTVLREKRIELQTAQDIRVDVDAQGRVTIDGETQTYSPPFRVVVAYSETANP